MEKKRLDTLLHELGYARSRERAKQLILSGGVTVDGRTASKPAMLVDAGSTIAVTEQKIPYVSRGGDKLEGALDAFGIDLEGRVCLDIGASTGGFTDCMLRRGAALVYAVDVGTGQLDASLAGDSRVVSLERTDIRQLDSSATGLVSFVTVDVSFISLRLVLPHIGRFCAPGAEVLCLVKPQFEVGRGEVGKGGIVRSEAARRRAVESVAACAYEAGFAKGRSPSGGICMPGPVENSVVSPLKGGDGNIEFFLMLLYNGGKACL